MQNFLLLRIVHNITWPVYFMLSYWGNKSPFCLHFVLASDLFLFQYRLLLFMTLCWTAFFVFPSIIPLRKCIKKVSSNKENINVILIQNKFQKFKMTCSQKMKVWMHFGTIDKCFYTDKDDDSNHYAHFWKKKNQDLITILRKHSK